MINIIQYEKTFSGYTIPVGPEIHNVEFNCDCGASVKLSTRGKGIDLKKLLCPVCGCSEKFDNFLSKCHTDELE